jgi:[ribosomal protein S5]-alanine N-acetyltransferase
MSGPELRTTRLHLRPLKSSDLAALHRHWTEPQVRRFLWDGRIIDVAQVEEVIQTSVRLFRHDGAGLWSLRRRKDPKLLGCIGFWYFHEPPQREILFSLSPSCWGRGFAYEAACAVVEYALGVLEWPQVQGSADAPNEPSLHLLRKLGMQWSGEVAGYFGAIEIYVLTREEWRKRRA